MNVFRSEKTRRGRTLAALAFALLVAAACATVPSSPEGAAEVRNKLTVLQSDPNLAVRAKVELRDAEVAVRLAEQPLPATEASLGAHRVYMADRQVEIARARATTRYAEDQRARFAEERDAARLAARTQEADDARYDADRATAEADRARAETDRARAATASATAEADRARAAAVVANDAADAARRAEAESSADAARQAADLQRQIDELQAEVTDRGLVLTLGDVLFTTGSAELQGGASDRLNKLINFLNEYPERLVLIEGHTDSMGTSEYNQGLSQRRSESVKYYLTQQGIATQRLSTSGMGENQPIASNDSAAGRLQNRRVEIIIENPPLVIGASRQ
ncbi:MAG: OmpA family protein [Lysobacterales bacterium]|nr:MAG: OmpA family protein [Xanthomonadales bacterium]